MKKFKRRILSILIAGILISPAFAYRPFGTEDSGVAGKGVFQTELSFDYLKWSDGMLERNFLFIPIYGLTDNLEVSIELPYMLHANIDSTSSNGAGDVNLVLKNLLIEEGKTNPAFTMKGVVKLDNGDSEKGLGSGDKDYSIFAVISKGVGKLTGHAHIGYSIIGKAKNSNLKDIPLYGIAVDFAFSEPLHLLCEVNGNRHSDSLENDDPRNLLIGAIYKQSEKILFDYAFKLGLSKTTPAWNFTAGTSITL